MKIGMVIFLLTALPNVVLSQQFYFKCFYHEIVPPQMYFVPQDNIFDNTNNNRISLVKDSDSSSELILKPSQISFFKIGADPILVCPGEHVEGAFNGIEFAPHDTNTINFTLERINRGFSKIVNNYHIGEDFNKFKMVLGLLLQYKDSNENILTKDSHPWADKSVTMALKEYLCARLAHFLVLPILFKNDYNETELNEVIKKNISIVFPEYWLQIESGRIFLQTYYRKMDLPKVSYNLQKSVENKFFSFHSIRKLAYHNYFLECLEKGIVKTKDQLLHDYNQAISKLVLSSKELEEMKNVDNRIQKIGADISEVFSTLPLINREGKILSLKEKKALIDGDNIILDFWASWCIPCRKKMTKLSGDKITLNQKKCRIIYLSIDEDDNSWKKAFFPFLNKNNSFRIANGNNQFVNDFAISRIPRYILVSQSALISSDFEF
jgi:thiol-disulfide isomerase/thioredoxin